MKTSKHDVTTVTPKAHAFSLLLLSVASCRKTEMKQREVERYPPHGKYFQEQGFAEPECVFRHTF